MKGFKAIYKRNHLQVPTVRLEVDDGNEFKGEVKQYFILKLKVHVRVGQPGRHRQQCLAECANKLIGQALHQRMAAQELLTGEVSREWAEDLKIMVQALDKRWQRPSPKLAKGLPKVTKETELLSEGTRVRVALDEPIGVIGEKLYGKFRASDIRWDPEIKTIKKVMLIPEQPPIYLVSGQHGKLKIARASYTRNMLQVVPEDENPPPATVIRGQPKNYIAEKILKSRKRKGVLQYLVKWKRFPEEQSTWELGKTLEADIPNIV